ncbi:MAG: 2-(1,2-epoxy-1,2-dihydrophenyl)acetyl-CoA isomerase PaaG [Saprospiraceae bacterium]|nr:2-(1,2-epoxy-1,2-dihydrophenyl)acetyl-CoA isomerase PaaG [Saprospiraceae bacterium]
MDSILFEILNGVAKITLNRPAVFNSFNQEMAFALHQCLDECKADESIRAIYLTGSGKAFCAGQDLQEVVAEDGPDLPNIVAEHYNPIIERIRNIEKPVVCGVNGVAAGAGANIALACDITVAAESASFIQAFSKIGLIPDSGGTFFLPRIIGMQRAAALIMLGDKVSATEAAEMGMIYKVMSDKDFPIDSFKIAEKLAKMPTKGLGLTKRALNYSLTNDLSKQLALEGELQSMAGNTEDYQEGVQAFLEKRKPVFKGK